MSSLSVISKQFAKQMIKILPDFQVETDFSWLKYATLDKPLSKLGYLKAYRKNFL